MLEANKEICTHFVIAYEKPTCLAHYMDNVTLILEYTQAIFRALCLYGEGRDEVAEHLGGLGEELGKEVYTRLHLLYEEAQRSEARKED